MKDVMDSIELLILIYFIIIDMRKINKIININKKIKKDKWINQV